MRTSFLVRTFTVFIILFFCSTVSSRAYSVLTHEAIIDECWDKSVKPLLKHKYPSASTEQLDSARAYSYGGAILQDLGYYPFSPKLFTDLAHYVRSGDFVIALLDEASDLNEYAFALGALAHYTSDIYGHALGINTAVPLAYPKVKAKFGNNVTFEQDHLSHLRMEFSFDVLQTARGNYASKSYHDFIGFQVAMPVLERAFLKTYGLELDDVFANLTLSISTFRWTVRDLIPQATKYAWFIKKADILKANPDVTKKKFRYHMKRSSYYSEFGKNRMKPKIQSWIISLIIRIMPKLGPLRSFRFHSPGELPEKLFLQSFDTVCVHYCAYVNKLNASKLHLENKNFDTGKMIAPCEYTLTDENYGKLLLKLKSDNFEHLNATVKKNILAFYRNPKAMSCAHPDEKEWKKILEALEELKQTPDH